jgi:LacI family repressor for deo operon, udp, cdd, tsx, nupC, and nupG
VAPTTRDRVLQAASDLGYVIPNSRQPKVGVLARFPAQWFFARALTDIERILRAVGYGPVLYNIGDPEGRRLFFEQVVPLRELNGLIVISSSFDERERTALDSLQVPITVVGGYAPGLVRAGIDDEAGARMATRHLIGLGHRDIGLISFSPDDSVGYDTTTARRRGLESALLEAGLKTRPEWMIAGESTMRGGVRAVEELLTRANLPSAIFAMSDEMAIGALQILRRAGIDVPGHMSVIGFDDHEMAEFSDLTTISQPVTAQAEMATRLLLDRMQDTDHDAGDVVLPTRLIVRGTTGPAQFTGR